MAKTAKRRPDVTQIDLNLVYTFRAVVESGGVVKAAKRLGRSQPAITARIRQLESQLGVKLFERIGRGVELTAVGRSIDVEVVQLLENVHAVLDKVASAAVEAVGTLRVGCLPTASVYLLAEPIARFRTNHPLASVEIQHGLTNEQLVQLKKGALDVVVSVSPLPEGNLDVMKLGEARPRAVFPRGRRSPTRRAVKANQLREAGYIVFARIGDVFFERVAAFLEQTGLDRSARIRVAHIQTIQSLVLQGAGTSILPDYTIGEGLVGAPVAGLSFSHPIWLATRKTSAEVPLIARFLEEVRKTHPRFG